MQDLDVNVWAIVEMFGHKIVAGYVTLEKYGVAALFRVDTPELPEREVVLTHQCYLNAPNGLRLWANEGTKVRLPAEPARTKLVGISAIYALTPYSKELVLEHLERARSLPAIILEQPSAPAIAAPIIEGDEEDDLDEPDF